jgi:hypothetical protein
MDANADRLSSSAVSGNRRPKSVTSLMCGRDVYPAWYISNKGKNRFFIVNIDYVMGRLDIDYTRTRAYFERATELIKKETQWNDEYGSDYVSSHTQINPTRRHEAKHFGHSVAIIVAMEVAATEKKIKFNVYDWLRILPAQYFVDRLDKGRLDALVEAYTALSDSERAAKFGTDAKLTFGDLCLTQIEQRFSPGLLDEIVEGHCITKFTASLLMKFINENFPDDLHVGPVVASGMEAVSNALGTKRAAPRLRVPKTLDQQELGECR